MGFVFALANILPTLTMRVVFRHVRIMEGMAVNSGGSPTPARRTMGPTGSASSLTATRFGTVYTMSVLFEAIALSNLHRGCV